MSAKSWALMPHSASSTSTESSPPASSLQKRPSVVVVSVGMSGRLAHGFHEHAVEVADRLAAERQVHVVGDLAEREVDAHDLADGGGRLRWEEADLDLVAQLVAGAWLARVTSFVSCPWLRLHD